MLSLAAGLAVLTMLCLGIGYGAILFVDAIADALEQISRRGE